MYLCIIDTNQHHDGTTTYPPHTLGSLRFRNGGAGTTGLYPRHLGFRHDPRNRRPCEPYLHGREPRQYARSDPRRGHHLRLHGTPIHQASDPPRRENHRQGDIRPGQPPRRLHQGTGRLLLRAEKGRHAHHPGQCHAAHEIHRGALPGRCGRRAAALHDPQRLLLHPPRATGTVRHRLCKHLGQNHPARTAPAGIERAADGDRPARDRTGRTGIDQRCLPHPRDRSPLRHAARRPRGAHQRHGDRHPRHRHRPGGGGYRRTKRPESADNRKYY